MGEPYGADGAAPDVLFTKYRLEPYEELRIEVDFDKKVTVVLESGTAEIFGAELAVGQRVTLSSTKVAVFSWHGATVGLEGGPPAVAYTAGETPMVTYVNVHSVLDRRRTAAAAAAAGASGAAGPVSGPSSGPRVMLIGPTDSGKSSLAKTLLNYAVRSGHCPLFVDLDVGQGSIAVPGCLGAAPIDAPIDAGGGAPLEMPLVYYYGHASPSENPELYEALQSRLAAMAESHLTATAAAGAAGMVVNTMGWVDGLGYDLLRKAIEALKCDTLLVIGQDRLHSDLEAAFRGRPGVVVVKGRAHRSREYFYGPAGDLSPHSQSALFHEVTVFRVGGGFRAPASALPAGAASTVDPTRVEQVMPSKALERCVLAVSHAATPEEVLGAPVAGFICVTEVDMVRGRITYLAPCPGRLPSTVLVCGTVQWAE